MINESALKDTLLALVREHRTSFDMIVALTYELVALRETVRGLDPTFGDVMEDRRKRAEEKGFEKAHEMLARYDQLIQILKGGYVC